MKCVGFISWVMNLDWEEGGFGQGKDLGFLNNFWVDLVVCEMD